MSNTIRIDVVQLKRGNKADLERVLRGILKPADGEPIFEIDTGKLKFGDGIHNYVDLEYFRTGDIQVADALNGQILTYDAAQAKWVASKFADNKSIEYTENGLQIAGFNTPAAQQGYGPIVNEDTINWQKVVTDETLNAKVQQADSAAYQAGQAAASAFSSAENANRSAGQAEQFRDATAQLINDKFWFGTRAEYETEVIGQNQLHEGTIYFIRDYDWIDFPNN